MHNARYVGGLPVCFAAWWALEPTSLSILLRGPKGHEAGQRACSTPGTPALAPSLLSSQGSFPGTRQRLAPSIPSLFSPNPIQPPSSASPP